MAFWTDMPIVEWGEVANEPAPWRRCTILGLADHNRLRVLIKCNDDPLREVVKEIKALKGGYVYCFEGDRSSGISIWHEDWFPETCISHPGVV